jgi:hypothetical protein
MKNSQKIVVTEVNEVPFRVYERYAREEPSSAIAYLLASGQAVRTFASDVSEDFLYPSQTWASFNTGVPYEKHRIHWYQDPKPTEYPFYWRSIAERGHAVGVINTLHSSPLKSFIDKGNYNFCIPDCFADDSATHPAEYKTFQSLNTEFTRKNGRKSDLKTILNGSTIRRLGSPRTCGITLRSATDIASTLAGVATGVLNKERLRNLQFPLLAEIFLSELNRSDVDLAVLFTNHVAANQHRYWYALFPEDFKDRAYPDEWVNRYRGEILAALKLLDKYLHQLVRFCLRHERILVVCSSMGQVGNQKLTPETVQRHQFDYRLDDPVKFARALVTNLPPVTVKAGMIPQYSLLFDSPSLAMRGKQDLDVAVMSIPGIKLTSDLNGSLVTLSAGITDRQETFSVRGRQIGYRDLGFIRFEVDDHHSGRHHPEGSLIVLNDKAGYFRLRFATDQIDYLKFAPAVNEFFA